MANITYDPPTFTSDPEVERQRQAARDHLSSPEVRASRHLVIDDPLEEQIDPDVLETLLCDLEDVCVHTGC